MNITLLDYLIENKVKKELSNFTFKKKRKHSEETKKKISLALKGRTLSDEHKRRISENKDRARKISITNKGRKFSEIHKKNIRLNHHDVKGEKNPMYGKHHSNETMMKISKKRKEWHRKNPDGQREENNPSWKGGISWEKYGKLFDERLKEIIRKKYDYKCQLCGEKQRKEKLSVHHIDYTPSSTPFGD